VERQPSAADSPPASRVGDELQQRAEDVDESELSDDDIRRIEDEAMASAKDKQWDQKSTEREGQQTTREENADWSSPQTPG
jgi:hypothetical protein